MNWQIWRKLGLATALMMVVVVALTNEMVSAAQANSPGKTVVWGALMALVVTAWVVSSAVAINTERKKELDVLTRAEEGFRRLFEEAPVAYHEINTHGIVQRVNLAGCALFDYAASDIIGKPFWAFLPPDAQQQYRELLRRRISGQEALTPFHRPHLRRDGTLRTVEVHHKLIHDPAGPVTGMRIALLDVTERKRAEVDLVHSEERYRMLFQSNPQPIWVHDEATLAILAVNRAAVQCYGYSEDEFAAININVLHLPEDVPTLGPHLRQTSLEIGKARAWKHRRKDGTLIEVEVLSQELDFWGHPARLVLVRDVTERNKAEAALRASEERYRELLEGANYLIYSHDLQGKFTTLNRAAERVTGYSRTEALRLNVAQVIAPEYLEYASGMVQRKLSGKPITVYEIEIITKHGARVALEVNTRLIYQDGKPVGVQGIAQVVRAIAPERHHAEASHAVH